MNEAIGAVAGHESGHVEKENTTQGLENKSLDTIKYDVEARPNEIENNILKELRNKRFEELEKIKPIKRPLE